MTKGHIIFGVEQKAKIRSGKEETLRRAPRGAWRRTRGNDGIIGNRDQDEPSRAGQECGYVELARAQPRRPIAVAMPPTMVTSGNPKRR